MTEAARKLGAIEELLGTRGDATSPADEQDDAHLDRAVIRLERALDVLEVP